MSIHEGHRQRVKDRFRKAGLDGFEAHQVLELLLFYCIPRKDTNEIAHRLIERFGDFDRVLDTPVRELEKVEGMGKSSAEFIALIKAVGRYYYISRMTKSKVLPNLEACGDFVSAFLHGKADEALCVLCLDAKCKVLDCRLISEGSVNSVGVPIRKIVEIALNTNATSVIIAHNHPSGVALPSSEDIQTTFKVAEALDAMDVKLIDHIIVVDDDYVSLAQSGIYDPKMTF